MSTMNTMNTMNAMNAYDLAKRNYGRTWTIEMLAALVAKGKLTADQYRDITGETYPE